MRRSRSVGGAGTTLLAVLALAAGCGEPASEAPGTEGTDTGTAAIPTASDGSRTYVERLGTDTMAVERVRRADGVLEGSLLTRNPRTRLVEYTAETDADGWITSMEGTVAAPGDEEAATTTFSARVEGDSIRLRSVTEGDTTTASLAHTENHLIALPFRLPAPVAMLETAAIRHRAGTADSVSVTFVDPTSGQTFGTTIYEEGPGALAATQFGQPIHVAVDEEGRVLSVDGRETTVKVRTEPEAGVDVDALAAEFARRDAAGEGVGQPSPAATANGTVAGVTFNVRYSQPAMRGREIWGGLVPYGEVWRTGANAATHLEVSDDIVLGDVEIPAGSYTLWSTYTADSAELIVNSQTGQWGTQYDAEQDFARIPMEVEELAGPVERFTIEVLPEGAGDAAGRLALSWADRRYWVPIRVP